MDPQASEPIGRRTAGAAKLDRARAGKHRDLAQYCRKIGKHRIVRDSKNPQTTRTENLITFGVVIDLGLVNLSVDFDNQTSDVTVEVGDKPVDDLLPAKVKSGEPVIP
jgi:hypothetical protein